MDPNSQFNPPDPRTNGNTQTASTQQNNSNVPYISTQYGLNAHATPSFIQNSVSSHVIASQNRPYVQAQYPTINGDSYHPNSTFQNFFTPSSQPELSREWNQRFVTRDNDPQVFSSNASSSSSYNAATYIGLHRNDSHNHPRRTGFPSPGMGAEMNSSESLFGQAPRQNPYTPSGNNTVQKSTARVNLATPEIQRQPQNTANRPSLTSPSVCSDSLPASGITNNYNISEQNDLNVTKRTQNGIEKHLPEANPNPRVRHQDSVTSAATNDASRKSKRFVPKPNHYQL